jgi:hypothetical protein
MMKVPEEFRFFKKNHPLSTTKLAGNNGTFVIPHYRIPGYTMIVQATDVNDWEHIYVQVVGRRHKNKATRYPTYEEMKWIKELFWGKDDLVLQYFAKDWDYTNASIDPYVLHLWRPKTLPIPKPVEKVKVKENG